MTRKVYEDGIYEISNAEYHGSAGLSRSALMVFNELPMQYWYQYLSGEYEAPKHKEEYYLGSALHSYVLEPDKFEEEYYIGGKWNRASNIGKAGHAEDIKKANGRQIISESMVHHVCDMAAALANNPIAANLLKIDKNSRVEKSIYWTDKETGIQCKVRPDMLMLLAEPCIIDLKSCDNASPRGFQISSIKYGYYLQMGMIFEALKAHGAIFEASFDSFEKCIFVCVEKQKPYPTAIYMLQNDALQYGIDQFHSLLRQYKACLDKDSWPDYGVQMLGVPKWAINEVDYDA